MTLKKRKITDALTERQKAEYELDRKIRRSLDSEARFWIRRNDFLVRAFFLKYVYLKDNSDSSLSLNPSFDFLSFAKNEKNIPNRINDEIKYLYEHNDSFSSLKCMFERGDGTEVERLERRVKNKSFKIVIETINSKEVYNSFNWFSRYLKNKYEPSRELSEMGTTYLMSDMSGELEKEILAGIGNELKRWSKSVQVYDLSFSNESLYAGIVRECSKADKKAVFFFNEVNNKSPAYFFMKTWFLGYRNIEVNCIKEQWYAKPFTEKGGNLRKFDLVFGNVIDADAEKRARLLDDIAVTNIKSLVKTVEKNSEIPKENYIYYFLLETMNERAATYMIDNFSFLTYKNYFPVRKMLVDEGFLSRVYSIYGETYSRANIDPVMMVWDKMRSKGNDVIITNFKRVISLTNVQNITAYDLVRMAENAGRRVSVETIADNDYNLNISNYLPDENLSSSQRIEETVEKLKKSVDIISDKIDSLSRLIRFK
jgi:hypothetical protein